MYDFLKTLFQLTCWVSLGFSVILFSFGDFPYAQEAPKSVRIGVLAKRGAKMTLEKWGPTADYLTKKISGLSFTILPIGYDEIYPAAERGDVDFILANSQFYVGLELLYDASRIATLKNLRMGKGYKVYGGVVFSRADREDIKSYSDLKGKTFMTLDETAFASWPAVWLEMKERGIDPYRDFADLRFKGPMDAVVYAVLEGKVDAGSVRTDLLERMAMEGRIRLEDLRVLHEHGGKDHLPFLHSTRSYPEWPLAKLKHTPDELAEKVVDALLEMTPDSPAARVSRITGWTIPLNYQPVHEALKSLRLKPYEEYGKITPKEVFRQYWYWFLGFASILISLFIVHLLNTNRKLGSSVAEQMKEITSRKRAEEELKEHSERLEEIVEERTKDLKGAQKELIRKEKLSVLGQLAGGVGHELRNPLGVISNAVYYLKLVLQDADNDVKEYLETISTEVDISTEIISDLLDLSRARPGRREKVEISELINQAIDKHMSSEEVELTTKIASDLPSVYVDSRQIGQVLQNMVTNAYQAMPGGGKLTISARAEKERVILSIIDTGCGISRENIKKLFEPLFTTKARGIGLGLTVCKNLVETNGGSIEVESKEGKGSTFTLFLPINERFSS